VVVVEQVRVDGQRRGDPGVAHERRELQRPDTRRDTQARVGVAQRVCPDPGWLVHVE
jgi:hypothetical protein